MGGPGSGRLKDTDEQKRRKLADHVLPMDRLRLYLDMVDRAFYPLERRMHMAIGSYNVREKAKYALGLYDLYTQRAQLTEKLNLVQTQISDIETPTWKMSKGTRPVSVLDMKIEELVGLSGSGAIAGEIETSRENFKKALSLCDTRGEAINILEAVESEASRLQEKLEDHIAQSETTNKRLTNDPDAAV